MNKEKNLYDLFVERIAKLDKLIDSFENHNYILVADNVSYGEVCSIWFDTERGEKLKKDIIEYLKIERDECINYIEKEKRNEKK